uniref:Costars domain-containing protein n=3 Tax=Musca domestica TaxID=7370 RepID=T1PG31_MUSDO
MADLSHELGALRFVMDSPLSSKVAMFNNQVNQHKQSQLLNPFSQTDGRSSPKPTFSKDEYGKPLAGSLTEMRGQKANIHVLKEMLELCQIIDSEGYNVKDEPSMRVIPFGELFNIYNYISDKVVGILLRARKHKLVEFEGEMLFQRRDDDVPIFLLKPIAEIRRELNDKIESIKRSGSPAPQATSVLLDKKAHGLDVPRGATPVSRTPTPQSSKAASPVREPKKTNNTAPAAAPLEVPKIQLSGEPEAKEVSSPEPQPPQNNNNNTETQQQTQVPVTQADAPTQAEVPAAQTETASLPAQETEQHPTEESANKSDVNNNPADLPVVEVIEATAIHVRSTNNENAPPASNAETVTTPAA